MNKLPLIAFFITSFISMIAMEGDGKRKRTDTKFEISKKIKNEPYFELGRDPLLIEAVKENRLDIVKGLLELGIDINDVDSSGNTALFAALNWRNQQIPKYFELNFFKSQVTINNEIIAYLLVYGIGVGQKDIEIANLIDPADRTFVLKKVFQINNWLFLDNINISLVKAVKVGNLPQVRVLACLGADVNLRTTGGNTILGLAIVKGHFGIVKKLLDSGARVNAQNKDRKTALSVAKSLGNKEMIEMLLNYGANPFAVN